MTKYKAKKTYGRHIERLSSGRNIIKISDVSDGLNLAKWIKANLAPDRLIIEPIDHGEWGLSWRGKPPRKLGESRDFIYFDF